MSGNFVGHIKAAKYRFELQDGTWDFSWDEVAGKGFIFRWCGKHVVFLELWRDSWVTMGNSRCLLCWPREVQSSNRVARESWGLLSSHCRANRPHLGLCPEANVPLQGRQGSGGCIPDLPEESASSWVEANNSALLLSHNGYVLEPPEWPKGSQTFSSYGQVTGHWQTRGFGSYFPQPPENPNIALQSVERELLGEGFPRTPACPDLLQASEVLQAIPLPAILGMKLYSPPPFELSKCNILWWG